MKESVMEAQTKIQAQEHEPKAWPKVAIIILNWNGWRDTLECLGSVYKLSYPNYLTIVVDNASWDDSVGRILAWAKEKVGEGCIVKYSQEEALKGGDEREEVLEQALPQAKLVLICNEENLGFTGGNNVGIHYALRRICPVDYVFLLNNDAQIEEGCLTQLIDVDHKANAGIIGPVALDEKGKQVTCIEKASLVRHLFAPIVSRRLPPPKTEDEFWMTFWVGGHAMLIRRDVLNAVYSMRGAYLNNDLFFYYDELEFCFLAHKLGYKCALAKKGIVYHKLGQSYGGWHSPIGRYYSVRNRILLASALLPRRWKVLFYPANFMLCLGRIFKMVINRKASSVRAIICGLVDGYRGVTGKWKYHNRAVAK